MDDLLQRLNRDDPTALAELGHALLPFVQAAVLARQLKPLDANGVLTAFRAAVAALAPTAHTLTFHTAVVERIRESLGTFLEASPDPGQADAVAALDKIRSLTPRDREMVIGRFVERLPASLLARHFRAEPEAVAAVLAQGALLLGGPAPAGTDWSTEPSLLEPDAAPISTLVELENLLTTLAIDVTALETEASMPRSTAVPVVRQGFSSQPPAEHYPSQVQTQNAVDLPGSVEHFVIAPKEPEKTHVSPAPPPDITPQLPQTARIRGPIVDDERTTPMGRPVPAPLPQPSSDPERTELRSKPLPAPSPATDSTFVNQTAVVRRGAYPAWWWSSAGLCAVLGVGLYWGLIARTNAQTRDAWPLIPVLVAKEDLAEGEKITFEMLATRSVPEVLVTPSVLRPESLEKAVGQKLTVPLQAGDHLLWDHFESARLTQRFSKRIQSKHRAYSIPISQLRSVGGWVGPTDNVDLLMTLSNTRTEYQTATILQDIEVLAVGKTHNEIIGRLHLQYTDVSVLLTPEQVEALGLAVLTGELTASLRTAGDHLEIQRGTTVIGTLLNDTRRIDDLGRRRKEALDAKRK